MTEEGDTVEIELAALRARVRELEAGLHDLEWADVDEGPNNRVCRWCYGWEFAGHKKECRLATLLAKT